MLQVLLVFKRALTGIMLCVLCVLQVLRLEPHMVVSNRTSVPLQLLQCRPVLAAEGIAAGEQAQRVKD